MTAVMDAATEHRTRYLARSEAVRAVAEECQPGSDARSLWLALANAAAAIARGGRPDNPLYRRPTPSPFTELR